MAKENLEVLNGVIDGSNRVFTSTFEPTDSMVVYINGITYPPEDTVYGFSVVGSTWTLTTAPETDDVVAGYYISA